METGKGGTSRQDKKILTTTLAKSLGDADLETRDGAYHRRDAFPPVAHRGNVVARHASHHRVFSAFTFTPSFMGERPAHDGISTRRYHVLKWWASNETKFPAVSVMVRQYLGVPATSLSIAGRTYDDLRQSLKDDMLETTMWARINREKRHCNRSV